MELVFGAVLSFIYFGLAVLAPRASYFLAAAPKCSQIQQTKGRL